MRQRTPLEQQDKTCPQWDSLRVKRDKCGTWDRPLDDGDDTCTRLFTTLCVSMTDVYIAKKTQKNKITSMTKQSIYQKLIIGQSSKRVKRLQKSSWGELECLQPTKEKPRKALKFECNTKFWTVLQLLQHILIVFLFISHQVRTWSSRKWKFPFYCYVVNAKINLYMFATNYLI